VNLHVEKLRASVPEKHLVAAARIYEELTFGADFPEFLTLRAYDYLD
jgi:hypothetical protein